MTTRSTLGRTRIGDFTIHSEHAGSGPPVVLLHGLSGSRRWWRFTLPALARRFRVHVPELVGFGGSRAPTRHPDLPEMAAILADWIRGLDEPGVTLVGHSMGGHVAIRIAAEHAAPEKLVLVCSTGLPRPISLRMAARFVTGAIPPRRWGAPTFVPTIAADAVRAGPIALLQATRNLLRDDVTPLLPAIRCPTLILWGSLDPLVPVEHGAELARRIANSRFVILADAAHNPMADRPLEFNRVLLDFLDQP